MTIHACSSFLNFKTEKNTSEEILPLVQHRKVHSCKLKTMTLPQLNRMNVCFFLLYKKESKKILLALQILNEDY